MKKWLMVLIVLSGCAKERPYYAPNNAELNKFSYEVIADFNYFAGCVLIEHRDADNTITIKEKDLDNNAIGLWNGNIFLDPRIKEDNSWQNNQARTTLLHEIGHSLGYQHVADPCHIMHYQSSNCNNSLASFESFSRQIADERGCNQ